MLVCECLDIEYDIIKEAVKKHGNNQVSHHRRD